MLIRDLSPRESDLSFPRQKERSLAASVAYRLFRVSRALVGRARLMRVCLDGAWPMNRFAFEIWAELFNEDIHDVRLGLTEELLEEWAPKDGAILDVGCGLGRWCRSVAHYSKSVTGIDYDEGHIARARELSPKSPKSNIEYLVGDASKTLARQLDARTFDLTLLVHVLEHIDDSDTFLKSLHEVTGQVVIEVPDFDSDRLNIVPYLLGTRYYSDGDHVREYTRSILMGQLERSGWHVERSLQFRGSIIVLVSSIS